MTLLGRSNQEDISTVVSGGFIFHSAERCVVAEMAAVTLELH